MSHNLFTRFNSHKPLNRHIELKHGNSLEIQIVNEL